MIELRTRLFVFAFFCVHTVKSLIIGSPIVSDLEIKFDQFVYNEDADLTPRQLIEKYGYRGETHRVSTEDGYILEMYRITGPNVNSSPEGKEPILLVHGLLSSAMDWIITGPNRAFGYILADQGYDVWMGNIRGNTFSREHKKYTTNDKEYWDFSWHEIGCKDLPAMIDYVLENTNRAKLIYAGHSQGTTDFWVMASEYPEYQTKVKAMFALAPVAYVPRVRSPFYRVLARFGDDIEKMMCHLGWYEFKPTGELLQEVISLACDEDSWTQPVCTNVIFLVAGFGSDQLNTTMLTAILGHVPAGSSVKQIAHYAQLIKSRKFRQYDHGVIGNLKKYKQRTPPAYDLSRIKVPVYLHYASNDWLSDPRDVDRLFRELGNPVGKYRVPYEKFGHIDFLWAKDGKALLFDQIIGLMERYIDTET